MTSDTKCPLCGSDTSERTVKKGPETGKKFHVCTKYPECKGRIPVYKDTLDKGSTPSIDTLHDSDANTNVWFPITPLKWEVIPRHHSYLAFNNKGKLIIVVLPDYYMSATRGKLVSKLELIEQEKGSSNIDVAFIHKPTRPDDSSHLVPIVYSQEQHQYLKNILVKYMTKEGIDIKLKSVLQENAFKALISSIIKGNLENLSDILLVQSLKRIQFTDNDNSYESNSIEEHLFSGRREPVPVYIYTFLNNSTRYDKESFDRELAIRLYLENNTKSEIPQMLRQYPKAEIWANEPHTLEVLCRIEAEFILKYDPQWKSIAKLMLDTHKFQYIRPHTFKVLPSGKASLDSISNQKNEKSGSGYNNLGEPNIMQIYFNVGDPSNWGTKQSLRSPAITVFNDAFGPHTLATHLFAVDISDYPLSQSVDKPLNIDELDTDSIPDIKWLPLGNDTLDFWWTTDRIVKKLIWLSVRNLCSHLKEEETEAFFSLVKNPCPYRQGEKTEIIFGATPITECTVQISPIVDRVEPGAPYAFLIAMNEDDITSTPILASDTFLRNDKEGSLTVKERVFLKNYCITKSGIRKREDFSLRFMIRPAYELIWSGGHQNPEMYSFNKPNR